MNSKHKKPEIVQLDLVLPKDVYEKFKNISKDKRHSYLSKTLIYFIEKEDYELK